MSRGPGAGRRVRPGRVLVINAGSSNLKASVLEAGVASPLAAVSLAWVGDPVDGAAETVDRALEAIDRPPPDTLVGIGHRIVHGGPRLTAPVVVDAATFAELRAVTPLAPLHLPPSLAVIETVGHAFPGVPQVACFDTAFHARMPEVVRRYPVPDQWWTEFGIVRYGFHGLSVEWATDRTAELLGSTPRRLRIVVAHLGAGSSVTAVDRGRGVWTSMGYTPLEGLMMATRSGSIDPGIVTGLVRDGRITIETADADLLTRSGLLAVGGSADMRTLVRAAHDGDRAAKMAVAMYVDRAAGAIGEAATRLETLDAVTFTGGIGEGAAGVCAAIVRRLGPLGVAHVAARAARRDTVLGRPGVTPAVLRVEAREDLVIASSVRRLVS